MCGKISAWDEQNIFKLWLSGEICENKSWPATPCYRTPMNTRWNLLSAHITPTSAKRSQACLNTSPRKTCLSLQITSLLTACSHQYGSQSPLHTYINIRTCSLSLCIHTCWRHLQGLCCLLDPAVSLLEQMERNAGGGEQAHTSELCEERHILSFSYSLLV